MKISWGIEQDVPSSILRVPEAETGVEIQFLQKYVTLFFYLDISFFDMGAL